MITRFITSVRTTFNPFSPYGKTARSFLALLPPNARHSMKIDVKMLPRASQDPASLGLSFSMSTLSIMYQVVWADQCGAEDGKEMNLDLAKLKIKDITNEVDRHSRQLGRKEDLSSG